MKMVKILLAVSFFLSAFSFANAAAKASYKLNLGGRIHLDGLELSLLKIADSRCPAGMKCIWEGEVRATFEISDFESPVQEQVLILRPGKYETIEFNGYQISIVDVRPLPQDPEEGEKTVWLSVVPVS